MYHALHDFLMEDDNKINTDCIHALRKKASGTKENRRGHPPFRRIAANLRPEFPEEYAKVQQDVRYLPKEIWESFSPEQKKMYKAHLYRVKKNQGPNKLSRKSKSLPS